MSNPRHLVHAAALMTGALVTFGSIVAAVATAAAAEPAPSAPPVPPATQEAGPDYRPYKQSYHLPYANSKPVDFDHLQSLSVRASINGGPPLRFQIDTGSTGVVVGAGDVSDIDPHAPPGSITYTSSGIELDGVWTPVTITFPDAKDGHGDVATAVVPVLAVSERKVHPGAVNAGRAQPMKNPKVYMFGVGNGRGKEPHQERNPWVNLKEMRAGTVRRGYALTRDGITLGLTADAVGEGYLFEQLKQRPSPADAPKDQPKDWESPRGWVTIGGVKHPECNTLLDTGLTNMMIPRAAPAADSATVPVPADPPAHTDVDAGTDVEVHLLSGRLHYGFKVGDADNPVSPRRVTWLSANSRGPLINTGLRALALYDYLYDADGGYLGLRPAAKRRERR